MISQSQIDEVIERNNISDVISEYVKLERKGSGYMGLCPFHREKTPSFSVHEAKQIFKCFGCGKGGNVINFVMLAEGLDYVTAIMFLAERAGIKIEDTKEGKDDKAIKLKQDILSINKEAARYFYENLKKSARAQQYLRQRLIPVDVLKSFGLGYSTEEWDGLLKHFTGNNVAPELLLSAGLVLQKQNKDGYYDRFRGRVMFPIFDVLGNIIGFGGRVMDKSEPKYLNSPETPVYHKGKNLYGLNIARKAESRRVIIVEGYMDCIALHKADIKWAVASLGTALTVNQARLLKKYFDEVIIGYDADAAGQNATMRGMDILVASGFRVKVLSLAEIDARVKDPDEFLRIHAREEFIHAVERAKTLVEYKISCAAERNSLDKLDGRVEFLKQATAVLSAIDSAVERDMYVKWVSERYNIPREPLIEQVMRLRAGSSVEPSNVFGRASLQNPVKRAASSDENEPQLSQEALKIDRCEKMMIVLLSEDVQLMRRMYSEAEQYISGQSNRELLAKMKQRVDDGRKAGMDSIIADMQPGDAGIMADIIEAWMTPADTVKAFNELAKKIKNYKYTNELTEIYEQIKANEQKGIVDEMLLQKLNKVLQAKKL